MKINFIILEKKMTKSEFEIILSMEKIYKKKERNIWFFKIKLKEIFTIY